MTDTPIGDEVQAQDLTPATPATTPEPEPAPSPAPAPAPAPKALDQVAPFLVKEVGGQRYGFVIGTRDVDYDVPGPVDPATNMPTVEHVHFVEFAMAWFDGHLGGCNAETVERVQVAQG